MTCDILITVDEPEDTLVTPPALVHTLVAEAKTPAAELGHEARDFADRVRYVLAMECAWPHAAVDELIAKVVRLMPKRRP